ncbi:hypothetical protein [Megalodesulfovibrio paquesii]
MSRLMLSCLVLGLLAGCATVGRQTQAEGPRQLTLAELKANPARLHEVERAFASDTPVVLLLEQGQQLPLRLEVNTPAVTMAPVTGQLRFHRDIYVRISSKGLYLSGDGQSWTSIRDVDQTKALLGTSRLDLSFALQALADEGAAGMLSVNGTGK